MEKVLIVEDDQTLLTVYQTTLESENFLIEIAKDGQDALEKVKTFQPHVVLLDLMIPKVTGFDVLDKIKSDEATKNIIVIVLTNVYVDKGELLGKGAESVLLKTDYDPHQLAEKIRSVIHPPEKNVSQ